MPTPTSLVAARRVAFALALPLFVPGFVAAQEHDAHHAAGHGAHAPAEITGVAVPAPLGDSKVGVLVMAHGGKDAWNASVDEALAPLRQEIPTALAFGMAARATLEAGIDSLRAAGVERIAVVRMFLSGTSFRGQTDYLLGLSAEVPHHYMHHGPDGSMIHGEHAAGLEIPPAIDTGGLEVLTHDDGLKDWSRVGRILEARAMALSANPAEERVMVLAHGMGDDEANQAVLDDLGRAVTGLEEMGFAAVVPETLREDWPEARAEAEARIHTFMESAEAAGHTVLVIPFRLSGFGPYAKILEGWDYRAGEGLLPHPSLTDWARERAGSVACSQGWSHPALTCPSSVMTEEANTGN